MPFLTDSKPPGGRVTVLEGPQGKPGRDGGAGDGVDQAARDAAAAAAVAAAAALPKAGGTATGALALLAGISLAAPVGGQNNQNQSGVPNVFLTSQDNPQVNCLQLGADSPAGQIKEQHVTTQRPTTAGLAGRLVMNPGASFGANKTGAAVYLSDGLSTGSASGDGIGFQLARAGAAGSQMNTRSDAFAMKDVGGLNTFYPSKTALAFLGLQSNPWDYGYIGNLSVSGPTGFNGATPVGKQTVPAEASNAATTQALVNALRAAGIASGLLVAA